MSDMSSPADVVVSKPSTDWGSVCAGKQQPRCPAGAGAVAGTGGWGDDCGDEDEDFSDILTLLDSRDNAAAAIATSVAPSNGSKNDTKTTGHAAAKSCDVPLLDQQMTFSNSALESHTSEGPYGEIRGDIFELDELEEPRAGDNSSYGGNGSGGDHVDELVRRYLQDMRAQSQGEQEGGAARDGDMMASSELQQIEEEYSRQKQQMSASGSTDVDGGGDDDDDADEDLEITSTVATLVRRGHVGDNNDRDAAVVDKKLNKQRLQAEALFHRRLARCPAQILRYAYGGLPLWCSYPAPDLSPGSGSRPPACEMCGAERVFEMQLMPGLIDLLPRVGRSSTAVSDAVSRHSIVETGIDFGVVTVWSCPNSCGQWASEVVIAQPSVDYV